ncbi:hypothetical protein PMAYCL1PPCAC_06003, partial [Pristionchus mayeri]
LHTKAFPAHAKMAARVAALRLAAAASRPSDAVNPEHYRRMIRFFEMDSQDRNVTGIVRSARLTNVEQNRLSAEFVVTPCKIHHFGTLPGGCSATMVDCLTCAALIVATGRPAVSVNLNMSYMNPALLGTVVRIDAEVIKAGHSLAYTKAELIRVEDGAQIASAKHTLAFNKRV